VPEVERSDRRVVVTEYLRQRPNCHGEKEIKKKYNKKIKDKIRVIKHQASLKPAF
jgi:hypothetical protein